MKQLRAFANAGPLAVAAVCAAGMPGNACAEGGGGDAGVPLASSLAVAADAASSSSSQGQQLQEVVVTAQKRATRVQDTPATIAAVSGEALKDRHVQTLQDLQPLVPGVQIGKEQSGVDVSIRGISNGTAQNLGGNPSVAFHQDGVYTTSPNGLFFDISRLEVAYGPQGTLYGRNATGGAINVITNAPVHVWEGGVNYTQGNYNSQVVESVVNVPIGRDYALRAATYWEGRDGYNINTSNNQSRPGSDDARRDAARLQFLADFTPDLSLTLRGGASHIGGIGGGEAPSVSTQVYGCTPNPCAPAQASVLQLTQQQIQANEQNPRAFPTYLDGLTRVTEEYGSASLQWRNLWGGATLDSITGVDWVDAAGSKSAQYLQFAGERASINQAYNRQTSQEIRLASPTNQRWDWLLGLYYYESSASADIDIAIHDLVNPFSDIRERVPKEREHSQAIFGQFGYKPFSSLHLTLGLRQNWDRKYIEDEGITTIGNGALPPLPTLPGVVVPVPGLPPGILPPGTLPPAVGLPVPQEIYTDHLSAAFPHFDWKAGAEWKLSRNNMLYGFVATGYKAGGINKTNVPAPQYTYYRDESILASEVGSKNAFFHKHLQANLQLFDYDYRDFQVISEAAGSSGAGGLNTFIDNAAKMSLRGGDVDMLARVGGVKVHVGAEYLAASFGAGTMLYDPDTGKLADVSGLRPKSAPQWSGNLGVEYTFDMDTWGAITAKADNYFVATKNNLSYSPVVDANGTRQDQQGAYSRTDISLTFRDAHENYSLGAFVNNLSNQNVRVGYSAIDAGFARFNYASPRIYGVRLEAHFLGADRHESPKLQEPPVRVVPLEDPAPRQPATAPHGQ